MSERAYNLLTRAMRGDAKTISGISFAWDGDWYHVSGTATEDIGWRAYKSTDIPIVADKKYTLSVEFAGGMPDADSYFSTSFQLFSDFRNNRYKAYIMYRNEHIILNVDQGTLAQYKEGFQLWGPIIKGGATVDMRVRWMLVEGDTPVAWAPAEGEELAGGGALMSANLWDSSTANIKPDADGVYTEGKSGTTKLHSQVGGTVVLAENQTVHMGASLRGADSGSCQPYVEYADTAGNKNWVGFPMWTPTADWQRFDGSCVVPSGMTITALGFNNSRTTGAIEIANPTFSYGTSGPILASDSHTPYATQDHVMVTYATKASLKVTDDSVKAEVSARAQTDRNVADLSSRLTQTANSLTSEISDRRSAITTVTGLANAAQSTADAAKSSASNAVSTANSASSSAANAVETANAASSAASAASTAAGKASTDAAAAVKTANAASSNASGAVTTANEAAATANAASDTATAAQTMATENQSSIKQLSDSITSEVTERGKLAGRVGTLEGTTGTHTSKLQQLAASITSLVKGESTYTDPDGKSATSGIYSLVTQTRDSVTALFGQYTKTADLASTQAVKDAKKAGTDAASAASAAQSTADTAKANAATAVSTAKTAASDAATAKTNASTAVSTANSAKSAAQTASTNASNAVSTANSANSKSDSAVSTANTAKSTANAAKSTVDSLQVGGRNLALGTALKTSASEMRGTSATGDADLSHHVRWYNGSSSKHAFSRYSDAAWMDTVSVDANAGNVGIGFFREASETGLSAGDSYTLSWWAKTSAPGMKLWKGLAWLSSSGKWTWVGGQNPVASTGEWQHMTYTGTFPSDAVFILPSFGVVAGSSASVLYLRECKMEAGNRATGWSPAPEDNDAAVATAQSTADRAQSTADAALDNAGTANGRVRAVEARVSASIDGLDVRVRGVSEAVSAQGATVRDVERNMSFGLDGLVIGAADSASKVRITDKRETFEVDGKTVLALDGDTSTVEASALKIGGYVWTATNGGKNLTLVYRG